VTCPNLKIWAASLPESHSGGIAKTGIAGGRTLLMVVPPDTVTGARVQRQAGELPESGDDRSPAWSQDCKGDLASIADAEST
jgi:hypothetical protein